MTHSFDPASYGPLAVKLLPEDRLPELGPGMPNRGVQPVLESLSPEALFVNQAIGDVDMARCCLAALWLHHDFLDESHRISQEIETPEGSWWHGIMHRREPDPSNSKYWMKRVGRHRLIDRLAEESRILGYEYRDPVAFVDFCERSRGSGSPDEGVARRVQLLEWQILLDSCWRSALAASG